MSDIMRDIRSILREAAALENTLSLLAWDQRTYMPEGGATSRAEQISLIARLHHERYAGDALMALLDAAEKEGVGRGESDDDVIVRVTRRKTMRARQLPAELVARLSEAASSGTRAWQDARRTNDFGVFLPALERNLALQREAAHAINPSVDPYSALLEHMLPGFTAEDLDVFFDELKARLVPLVRDIAAHQDAIDPAPVEEHVPDAAQWAAVEAATNAIGFDYRRGRLDRTIHPFCTTIGPGDVRLTTRVEETLWPMAFFGTLHEMGHGLYQQGLPRSLAGTPAGDSAGLGIHESQSRFFENIIGRSQGFWRYFTPRLREIFPAVFGRYGAQDIFRAVNRSRPSFIRIQSDEVTYTLHIVLRFELERALLDGTLAAADLPGAWRQKMHQLLGITPPDDLVGVLQDVHWSQGSFAYFPSYAVGNVIAAQIALAMERDLGELGERAAGGDFESIRAWLSDHVWELGGRHETRETVRRATGEELSTAPYLRCLEEKFTALYGL